MTQYPRNYMPENWVVIKIKGDDPHYRVLGGWSGGYTTGESWRMNSGITKVEFENDQYIFHGSSGSQYICHKDTYGLHMTIDHVWRSMQSQYGDDRVELMKKQTDWMNIDWIIK